ncbi:MAG TPA: arsenate reductase ArsC [Burkholderiales bacterium]|nr:arsenate reductase ArsC [Burkholderiales bacterium]
MKSRPYNVLFLCTGNSARSIFAESILNHLGEDRFIAYSAGSHPAGAIHPYTYEILEKTQLKTLTLRSKSWDEFQGPNAPKMDFIFTVCASAAGEACPVWPGNPITGHWNIDDPASVTGSEEQKHQAFHQAYRQLYRRISQFISLPASKLDSLSLESSQPGNNSSQKAGQ